MTTTFHLRKKIAKHGKHAVIVVPKLLQNELVPGTIVDLRIDVVEERK